MIAKPARDLALLFVHGGLVIGLGAAALTWISLDEIGFAEPFYNYTLFIGAATAALYCGHRVVGMHKVPASADDARFAVIRKYWHHIRIYFILWLLVSAWLGLTQLDFNQMIWLAPGGLVGALYITPVLPGGKRLRDYGWAKTLCVGFSWGWLTAFYPWHVLADQPLSLSIMHGLDRMVFIILLTIPFEIRDLAVDKAQRIKTIPTVLGRRNTFVLIIALTIVLFLTSSFHAMHYFSPAYVATMMTLALIVVTTYTVSYRIKDDLYFSGFLDGLMILAVWIYLGTGLLLN